MVRDSARFVQVWLTVAPGYFYALLLTAIVEVHIPSHAHARVSC
jgi:hypothetical protein